MTVQADWGSTVRTIEKYLRLKSFPVAFKMLEKKEDLEQIPIMRRTTAKKTMCQLITLVRNFDWTVGADANDFTGPMCPSIIGLTQLPEVGFMDGTFRSIVWTKNKRDGAKYEQSVPRLPFGKYEAVAMAPLVYGPFDPDIVLIYANPAQMILLINALQHEDYEVMQFFCVGESSCSDAIARCYLDNKPSVSIPCYGERRYGHAQDEDLVMAIPAALMVKAAKNLEALYRRGIRYPISFAGAEQDLSAAFPGAYGSNDAIAAVRGNDNRLLLGVTGGIATGKSTVVKMLQEKGAPVIDFDQLARSVVEPGKKAYTDIVDFFGKQVLQEDGALDRAKLREIVFSDLEKRKKLESFQFPQIGVEFAAQLTEITEKDPNAIVQIDVPLMIETNMQHRFHKLLVVYTPQEIQIERLMKRDGSSKEEAAQIIAAQLPIDEKVSYADFIIDNAGDLDQTQKQVDKLWDELTTIQKEK